MAREKKTKPQPPVQLWTKETAPASLPQKPPLIGEANSLYRQTMTGKIAVGLHMISGSGSLAISDAERTSIVSAVTTGYQFWAGFAPEYADLQFHLIHMSLLQTLEPVMAETAMMDLLMMHSTLSAISLIKLEKILWLNSIRT